MCRLADRIRTAFASTDVGLQTIVVSFGYKYGIPVDADVVADMRFLPSRIGCRICARKPARDEQVSDYVLGQPGAAEFLDRYAELLEVDGGRLPPRGQAVRHGRRGLHGRKTPQRGDEWALATRLRERGVDTIVVHRDLGRMIGSDEARRLAGPKVVALGGGHGLAVSLSALRRVSGRLTAVVTVADDGGSSGRLRRGLGVLPPGDLRMALAALCGDDEWGRTWARVLQHRFASRGELHNHAAGNLLIVALWELLGGHVEGLDWVARLLGAQGRVLPMSSTALNIQALVGQLDGDGSLTGEIDTVVGQNAVATAPGPWWRSSWSRRTRRPARKHWRRSPRPIGWCSGPARGSAA